jgi:hypothetical protein
MKVLLMILAVLMLGMFIGCADDDPGPEADAAAEMGTTDSATDVSESDTAPDTGADDIGGETAVEDDGSGGKDGAGEDAPTDLSPE